MRSLNPFSTAGTILEAMRAGEISAAELLEMFVTRAARYEPTLNSIVVRDYERARRDARAADERRAAGQLSSLLGLPITVKESIDVEHLPSTAGVPFRVGHKAARDATTVARLRAAGAVVMGKTNVCTWLADYQADNAVYGRTNSPWDSARTAGGSSGGSATLAAGLTAIDLGSDLGGSIRVPPAFSGLFGHKPSVGIVPNTGHFPGSDLPNPAFPMAAQGPQARSAADLELVLDVIAGPDTDTSAAWQLHLPAARRSRLSEVRIAVLPPQSWLPVDSEILAALERVVKHLGRIGATVKQVQPPGLGDLRTYYSLFRSMMAVTVSARWTPEHRQKVVADKLRRAEEFHAADARGIMATASDLATWLEQREIYRAAWRAFFQEWDVLLAPITITPAFEHTTVPNADRRFTIDGREVEFEYMSFYPGLATLAGQPATVFPAGQNSRGLPLGLQVVGPCLEDRTTIRFAEWVEREMGGFSPPSGYE